jgi:5'(3')-deoxyribonucleotidase
MVNTMKKLRILVDIDGITADTLPHWLGWIANKTGVVAKVSDIDKYDFAQCSPLNQLPASTVYGALQDPGFTTAIPMMPGASENLKKLMDDGHEVYLVTARSGAQHIAETFIWVKEQLPFLDSRKQLIFCYNKDLLSADILIDDQAYTLTNYKAVHPRSSVMGIRYLYNSYLEVMSDPISASVELVEYGPAAWDSLYQLVKARAA